MPSHGADLTATGDTLADARRQASLSAGLGYPWLLAFGFTVSVCAVASFFVSTRLAALMFVFQGGVALPLAFGLERVFGLPRMAPDNPVKPLIIQVANIQTPALLAVLFFFSLGRPDLVPAAFAAVAAGHFLPYTWLHETKVYIALTVAAACLPWALTVWGGDGGYRLGIVALAIVYLLTALVLYFQYRQRSRQVD